MGLYQTRQQILANTSGRETRDSLARQRAEILGNTSGADTRASLAAQRSGVFAAVRGNNAGPTLVLNKTSPNMSRASMLRQQAMAERDPAKRAQLEQMAALEERYATQSAEAQNVIQQDLTQRKGADPFMWDAITQAKAMQRRRMEERAAAEYNAGLGQGMQNPATMKSLIRWDL